MSAVGALVYADVRGFFNGLRTIRRQPWRLALWIGWLVVVSALGYSRIARSREHRAFAPWEIAMQDLWICSAVVALGFVLATGPARVLGFFQSRAEAVMVIRGHIPSPVVAAYLQVRSVSRLVFRALISFAYLVLLGLPGNIRDAGALARELAFVAAIVIAIATVPLPRALARGAWRTLAITGGWALVLLGLIPVAREGMVILIRAPWVQHVARYLPPWHPGAAFSLVEAGDLQPLLLALAVATLASLVFVAAASDAYPELYEVSLANLELRERVRARREGRTDALPVPSSRMTRTVSERVKFHGALALFWLDAVQWSRRVPFGWAAMLTVLALAGGALLGVLTLATERELAYWTSAGVLANLFVAVAATSGVRIATDLRRPLWWLGPATLLERLSAWTFAPLWRDAFFLVMGALGLTLVTRDSTPSAALVVGGVAVAALTRAIGVAVFALLPDALDQRGPAVFLKVSLAYLLVAPAAIAAAVAALVWHHLFAATLLGTLVAVTEGVALVAFASHRLSGHVDRLSSSI